MRSSTGPMPTMSLRSSNVLGPVEQRRQRVVLEVDDEFAVARGIGSRLRAFAQQAAPVFGEVGELEAQRFASVVAARRSASLSTARLRTRRAFSAGDAIGVPLAPVVFRRMRRDGLRGSRGRCRLGGSDGGGV